MSYCWAKTRLQEPPTGKNHRKDIRNSFKLSEPRFQEAREVGSRLSPREGRVVTLSTLLMVLGGSDLRNTES